VAGSDPVSLMRQIPAGVIKRPTADGRSVYELPGPASEQLDRQRQMLDLRTFINDVRVAQNLVVVRTPPGHANAVGRAIDAIIEVSGFDLVDQFLRLAIGGNHIKPAARNHQFLGQAEHMIGNGIAMVVVVKEPRVEIAFAQGRLNGGKIHANGYCKSGIRRGVRGGYGFGLHTPNYAVLGPLRFQT
jgi:hypothetical protein